MGDYVSIGEIKVIKSPGKLSIIGLGSCVGVCLYDPLKKVGGMAHVMLPESSQFKHINNPSKFADLAIPMLLKDLNRSGAVKNRLVAKLAGGAQMFSSSDASQIMDIGARNIVAVKRSLAGLGIVIKGECLGGKNGRTMILDTENGNVSVRKVGYQPYSI
jgi:chemotaxis protein CheD